MGLNQSVVGYNGCGEISRERRRLNGTLFFRLSGITVFSVGKLN